MEMRVATQEQEEEGDAVFKDQVQDVNGGIEQTSHETEAAD
jgi:hypothetical protein